MIQWLSDILGCVVSVLDIQLSFRIARREYDSCLVPNHEPVIVAQRGVDSDTSCQTRGEGVC